MSTKQAVNMESFFEVDAWPPPPHVQSKEAAQVEWAIYPSKPHVPPIRSI